MIRKWTIKYFYYRFIIKNIKISKISYLQLVEDPQYPYMDVVGSVLMLVLGVGLVLVSVHCLPSHIVSQHCSAPEQSEFMLQSTITSTVAQNSGVTSSTGGQLEHYAPYITLYYIELHKVSRKSSNVKWSSNLSLFWAMLTSYINPRRVVTQFHSLIVNISEDTPHHQV